MNTGRRTEGQKFISDVMWIGASQGLMSLTGLVVLPALAKGYSTQTYGVWSQMVVTVTLLSISILTIQFDSATVRFLAAEDDKEKRRRAFGTMLWPILALNCLMFAISLILGRNLAALLFDDSQYAGLVPLVFLWASMVAIFHFSLSYLRARRKIKSFACIRLASSISRMLLIVLLALTGFDFYWLVVGVIAVEALFVAVVLAMIVMETGWPIFGRAGLKGYVTYSAPLLPGSVLAWVISASNRFFITHFLDISQTGIYSASSVLGGMVGLLSWPIGMVLFPTLSRLWEQRDLLGVKSYFQHSLNLFLMLAVPAVGGLYIISQPLLGILANSEFMVGGVLVLLVALGIMFSGISTINVYPIFLVKNTVRLPLVNAIGAVVNIGANIILIPMIGIMGAAISTILSYFVLSVIFTFWGKKIIDYKLDFKFLSKVILSSAVMVGCLRFLEVNSVVDIILVMILGVAIYGLGLFLLRALPEQERSIIKKALSGLKLGFRPD